MIYPFAVSEDDREYYEIEVNHVLYWLRFRSLITPLITQMVQPEIGKYQISLWDDLRKRLICEEWVEHRFVMKGTKEDVLAIEELLRGLADKALRATGIDFLETFQQINKYRRAAQSAPVSS